jgi:Tol biopolymer transport system component
MTQARDSIFRQIVWVASMAAAQAIPNKVASADDRPPGKPALAIAFASLRDRPAFASIHLYEHDGVGQGRLVATIPAANERADYHPVLYANGTRCLYSSKQVGGHGPLIMGWDLPEHKQLPEFRFNGRFAARVSPAVTQDGSLLLFCVWEDGLAGGGGWDLALYDARREQLIDLPGLNTPDHEQQCAISGNGALVAFSSSRPGGQGASDIYLYDVPRRQLLDARALNSAAREHSVSLSGDGRYVAFVSSRNGGAGGQDVWLYDRRETRFVELPGLNSVGNEQTPVMTPDGRYLAFVSERTDGPGERDLYLYDRQRSRLLPTPGLNTRHEEFDPSIAVVE